MRVFAITDEGKFRACAKVPFDDDHEEAVLESWLEANPDGILEDSGLLILGRQVVTNLGSALDLLGVDREGNLVVLELKRGRTPRETTAQLLEYASFVEQLDVDDLEHLLRTHLSDESVELLDYHARYFERSAEEPVSFNKDQRLLIVGQSITNEIRQTCRFLRKKGIRIRCLEFSFFQADDGLQLLSYDMVVGDEPSKPKRIASTPRPVTSEAQFLNALNEYGRPVFQAVLDLAKQRGFVFRWGIKGVSINVETRGLTVAIAYIYPPDAVFKQTMYTAFGGQGGMLGKIDAPEELADRLRNNVVETGLFQPAGKEFKCEVDRPFSTEETRKLLNWLEFVASEIVANEPDD